MKQLTKAEEQIMQVIWRLDQPFLREIVDELSDPKPHQNTVATVLKVLMEKKFIVTKSFGRMNRYLPAVSQEDYTRMTMKNIVKNYFQGSFSNAVSFMIRQRDVDVNDLEMLLKEIRKQSKK